MESSGMERTPAMPGRLMYFIIIVVIVVIVAT